MRSELDVIKKRIASNVEKEKEARAKQAFYQARLDNQPQREADITSITREQEVQRSIYNDNVKKRETSSIAVNLERRQIGEQFNLIDQARLPEKPFSPDRLLYNLFGLAGGLAIGLALVGFLEYRDSTFKADYDVANVLSLPVLAVVPLMRSDAERKSEFRKNLFLNLGLGSAVAVCFAVLAYTFVR
jgi:capsular polysaccharide biosynthesis protein